MIAQIPVINKMKNHTYLTTKYLKEIVNSVKFNFPDFTESRNHRREEEILPPLPQDQ